MSRIDELIAKYAPDGIQYKSLGDVLKIKNGKDHKHLGDGDIPVYGSGGIMRYADESAAEGPSVLIPRKGSLGNLFYVEGPFWVVDTIFRTEIDDSQLEPKFLFHLLLTMSLGEMNQAGGVPSQTQSVLNKLRIPVPPLEIQREIVGILDTFSKMEAELEAELEARKQQYEHYRSELFGDAKDKRIVTLGELCNSITTGKLDVNAKVDGGAYPFFTCDANPYEIDTYAFDTEAILLSGNGSRVGHVNYYRGKFNAYQRTYVVSDFSEQVHVPYLLQYLHGFFRQYVMVNSRKGSVPYITLPMLKNFQIPLPALTEQKQMSNSLDKFDALVNDLSVGLPAELAARRQQYEYYRDKLLTFKELEPAS